MDICAISGELFGRLLRQRAKAFGERVMVLCAESGLTDEELTRRIGYERLSLSRSGLTEGFAEEITQADVNRMLRGESMPSYMLVFLVMRALHRHCCSQLLADFCRQIGQAPPVYDGMVEASFWRTIGYPPPEGL